ncbi:pyridoxal phosphate-dependent transferase, partial [Cerioporus squamosus]
SLGPDAHIVSVNDVYGGTFRYMTRVAAVNQGLETTFVDLENADDDTIRAAFRHNTKLIWIESPTNPTLRLIDIPRIVSLAREAPSRPLVLVDNTFLSPFYSSRWFSARTSSCTPSPKKLRFLQNAIGAVPSAYDCWLAQRGAKTLHLRMKAHGSNALAVARALQHSPHVEEVIYPGLSTHPRNDLAYRSLSSQARTFVDKYVKANGDDAGGFPYGGMISFRIRGGAAEAEKFLTATRLFTLAESLGGVESLAELPAQMTHGSIPPAERALLGIGDNLIRLSVGVEEEEDLVADVEQALEVAAASSKASA